MCIPPKSHWTAGKPERPASRQVYGQKEVIAKRDVAVLGCANASGYTASYDGKPWHDLLIPPGLRFRMPR